MAPRSTAFRSAARVLLVLPLVLLSAAGAAATGSYGLSDLPVGIPTRGADVVATGVGPPPDGYPQPAEAARSGATDNEAASAAGNELTIQTAIVALAYADPGSSTGYW